MTLPGHVVTIGERAAPRVAPLSTATGFVVGFAERGPATEPILCESLSDAIDKLGERVSAAPVLYDALDVAFREGASAIYVGRIVGPNPVTAFDNLPASSGDSMTVHAASPGAWGNDIDVVADATGATFTLTVTYQGSTVAASPALADTAAAIAWAEAEASEWIVLEDEGGGDPVDGTAALATGTDDRTNATDATRLAALNLLTRDLGPGQVAAPGFTSAAAHAQLLAHAAANNRRALLDGVDTDTAATLSAAALALRGTEGDRYAGVFAPWAIVPGISYGTTRTVPYSAVQLGLIAQAELESGGNPNRAAAGRYGRSRYAFDVSQKYSDADRELLNNSGVNVAILLRGVVTTYGNRTLVNTVTDGDWKWYSASRLVMGVAALAEEVLVDYDFEQIDGKGFIFSKLAGDLSGRACMPFYLKNALYGQTPGEAFIVNTGPEINTPASIGRGEIHAQIGIRVSESGEVLSVEIVKVPTTEEL